jgi:flagellar motor switch protein FliN
MPDSLPDTVDQIVGRCQAGQEKIAEAFARAFGVQFEPTVGEPVAFDSAQLAEQFSAPGLALTLVASGFGALFLIPQAGGLLPDWYASPDESQQAQLATLAQDLAKIVEPDSAAAAEAGFQAAKSLTDVVGEAKLRDDARSLEIVVKTRAGDCTARLVWPVDARSPSEGETPAIDDASLADAQSDEPPASVSGANGNNRHAALPPYTRSLLHIRVPISVTLATKRQPIGQILDLGAGSIIHFDKSCEEMLDLFVGEHRIAHGEAVKVGEKFGLRVTSIILPEERFKTINRR